MNQCSLVAEARHIAREVVWVIAASSVIHGARDSQEASCKGGSRTRDIIVKNRVFVPPAAAQARSVRKRPAARAAAKATP